jgi:hypothetical protein
MIHLREMLALRGFDFGRERKRRYDRTWWSTATRRISDVPEWGGFIGEG